jgi:hypothetical protein
MTPTRTVLLVAGLILLLLLLFLTTGVTLLPVSLALGPCLEDFTSPFTYQPRASPMASLRFAIAGGTVELCYGQPSARGRTVYGGLVPWDSLWRAGANEPTRLYTQVPVRVAGIPVPPGRYSVYLRPKRESWSVFISRSTMHWGNDISPAVRAREIGQGTARVEPLGGFVESFTITPESVGDSVLIHLDWERTRVTLPITAAYTGGQP